MISVTRAGLVLAAGLGLVGCRRSSAGGAGTPSASASQTPGAPQTPAPTPAPAGAIKTVFVIVMENTNWSQLEGKLDAPFINALPAEGAVAEDYQNPPRIHPSLPNYIWMEAGANLGILDDNSPAKNHLAGKPHLTQLLDAAGVTWKSYQQGISGRDCPLESHYPYAVKHNPFVYFDDVTGGQKLDNAYCIEHIRPYDELSHDLEHAETTPRYAFIVPDICHDMHDSCPPLRNRIEQGDRWLMTAVEMIERSPAHTEGGAIFITWDESEGKDAPIGLIVLSRLVKQGYRNHVAYTHSSLLKTVEEIFGVKPLLGGAAAPDTADLSDLFTRFPG